MEVSRKQKNVLIVFLHFWNLVEILNIFKKKITLIADVFPKLWTQCLKSRVSRDPLESNIVNAPKSVEIWMKAPLPYLVIAVKQIELQKVSVSDTQNLKTVS